VRKRKPKAGRPALPSDQAKASTFSIRFTAEERAKIELAAGKAGASSASEWARRTLLDAAHTAISAALSATMPV
jgi:hypothetical protein